MSLTDRTDTTDGWIEQLWPLRRWQMDDVQRIQGAFRELANGQDFPSPGLLLEEFRRLDPGTEQQQLDESLYVSYRKPRIIPGIGKVSTTVKWHPDNTHGDELPSQEQREAWEQECAALQDARERLGHWPRNET